MLGSSPTRGNIALGWGSPSLHLYLLYLYNDDDRPKPRNMMSNGFLTPPVWFGSRAARRAVAGG